tara:strand:- start:3 stop:707 length:705 start_codon:yes stop_codon:yes gene_type:complete
MNKPIAIITGASTGIGKKLAIELSDDYFVYLISRNKIKLENTKKIIEHRNNNCEVISCDISQNDAINEISSKIKYIENVELLINNAGLGVFKSITDTTIDDWDKTINTNLKGSFLMTKMIVDQFKANKRGKIIFVNSVAGIKPFENSTSYCASKYGMRGFASSLREELRSFNVKVISIFPGAVNTSIWDDKNMDEHREFMMQTDDLCEIIINSINAKNNCVVEEITIRRNAGDF